MDPEPVALTRHVSPTRVLVVTTGLIVAGAFAGAAAGVIGVTLWMVVVAGLGTAFDPTLWFFAAVAGAPFGAVLLPLAGFTALRRVPLGRLLATTILGTAIGAAIGATMMEAAWLVGAITGFVAATGWLWHRFRRLP